MKKIHKIIFSLILFLILNIVFTAPTWAMEVSKFGIHLLETYELDQANSLLKNENKDQWHYITIPFTLADLDKIDKWQDFFRQAKDKKIIPIIRLATVFENGAWKIPTRSEIVNMLDFLAALDWPTDQKHIIVFNEVNHAKEWGSKIDPASYALVLRFTASWAHANNKNFVVLPAAMDLAANNSSQTMEAFNYLDKMYQADPKIFDYIDIWNSHSYPNPGFSSSPEKTDKKSLRGFLHELEFVKKRSGRQLSVMITETGWAANAKLNQWLNNYYLYAQQHIWSNDQVLAVTPFLLQGAPGPFSAFSMLSGDGQPTAQYKAYQQLLQAKKDN